MNLIDIVIEERQKLASESKKGKLQQAYFELKPFSEVAFLNDSTLEVAFEGGLVVFKLTPKPNYSKEWPFGSTSVIGSLDYNEATHAYMFNTSEYYNLDDAKRAIGKFLAQF